MPKYLLPGLIITIALLLTLSGCRSAPAEPEDRTDAGSGSLTTGDTAPDFTLPAATDGEVSLSRLLEQQDVLLYFNMAYGWAPWLKQIVDLEGSPDFQSLDVALVSIAIDPVADLSLAVNQFGISTPLLSDEERNVSESYGVLQWAMPNGEPGHTFILVGKNGKVKWVEEVSR